MKQVGIAKRMKNGKTRVVVDLDDGESLMAVATPGYYKLAYPLDDMIVRADLILGAERVTWCVIEQKWI